MRDFAGSNSRAKAPQLAINYSAIPIGCKCMQPMRPRPEVTGIKALGNMFSEIVGAEFKNSVNDEGCSITRCTILGGPV